MSGEYGKLPRGKYSRPPMESEIKAAQSVTNSALEAARLLGISYNTYKKWAKRYGLHEIHRNKPGVKIKKVQRDPTKGKYPLDDILKGMYPNYPTYRLKDRLFKCGYKEQKCENCGWTETRVTDDKGPFLVDYIDGNSYNKKFENIRILCLNCTHNLRGYINRGKTHARKDMIVDLDVDRLQRERARPKIKKAEVDEEDDNWDDKELNLTEEEIQQLLGENDESI
jgi:hypothetical protein